MCHDAGVARATNRDGLKRLLTRRDPSDVEHRQHERASQGLSAAQIDSLARMLGSTVTATTASIGACTTNPPFTDALDRPRWNGWGGTPAQHRFQPAPMAQLTANQVPR
jgi:polyvinyl alcohol dehydrogenase (cytochrome)